MEGGEESGYGVGTDIGGTCTDIVVKGPDGACVTRKVLSTPDDYSRGIIAGLRELVAERAIPVASLREVIQLVREDDVAPISCPIQERDLFATGGKLLEQGAQRRDSDPAGDEQHSLTRPSRSGEDAIRSLDGYPRSTSEPQQAAVRRVGGDAGGAGNQGGTYAQNGEADSGTGSGSRPRFREEVRSPRFRGR